MAPSPGPEGEDSTSGPHSERDPSVAGQRQGVSAEGHGQATGIAVPNTERGFAGLPYHHQAVTTGLRTDAPSEALSPEEAGVILREMTRIFPKANDAHRRPLMVSGRSKLRTIAAGEGESDAPEN